MLDSLVICVQELVLVIVQLFHESSKDPS
jgi:hypothetical protein